MVSHSSHCRKMAAVMRVSKNLIARVWKKERT